MTEAEARRLLRDWQGAGGLETWIAEQMWRAIPGGWEVVHHLRGWRFRLAPAPPGLHLRAWQGRRQVAGWEVASTQRSQEKGAPACERPKFADVTNKGIVG
jgi:uncharacterized protein YbdZ (MbtH family)